MHKPFFLIAFATFASANIAGAQEYEVPPSDSTSSNVPYISDEAMKECVRIYNEAKWLSAEIDGTQVDNYDEGSVNAYNAMVSRHASMTKWFNSECAGKQSESAYRAAQELNAGK